MIPQKNKNCAGIIEFFGSAIPSSLSVHILMEFSDQLVVEIQSFLAMEENSDEKHAFRIVTAILVYLPIFLFIYPFQNSFRNVSIYDDIETISNELFWLGKHCQCDDK